MVRRQRKASFIDKHCDQYGLKIVTRGPKATLIQLYADSVSHSEENMIMMIVVLGTTMEVQGKGRGQRMVNTFHLSGPPTTIKRILKHNIHRNGLSIRRSTMNLMPLLPNFLIWTCHLQTL